MIFKRRDKPSITERARNFVYPRKGFWRGFGYIGKRIHRLPDTPHRIALGFACGTFASFTPFFTLHFFLAAGLAWATRGNIIAALFGTAVGNPLTFPFISWLSLWIGGLILGGAGSTVSFDAVMHAFGAAADSGWNEVKSWFGFAHEVTSGGQQFLWDVFLPYLIGGVAPGLVFGFTSYWIVGPIVEAYQVRRRAKFEERAAAARARAEAEQEAYAIHDRGEGDNA